MGWDYSANLVYGVLIENAPEGVDDLVEYAENICFQNGVDFTLFSYYGERIGLVLHDKDKCLVRGYEANLITLPAPSGPSDKLRAVLRHFGVEADLRWYLGVSVS